MPETATFHVQPLLTLSCAQSRDPSVWSTDSWFKYEFLKYMMKLINTHLSGLLPLSLTTPFFETEGTEI